MTGSDFIFIGTTSHVVEGRALVKVNYTKPNINPKVPVLLQRPQPHCFDFTFLTLKDGVVELLDLDPSIVQSVKDKFINSFVFGKEHFSIKFIH